MKTIIIFENGNTDKLIYDDIPEPICSDDQIKIKIMATSINHLDLWVRKGLPGIKNKLPIIPGSDGAGIITEIGNNVKKFAIGEDVIIQPGIYCGFCKFCKSGNENFCIKYKILGENVNGTHVEYLCLNENNVYKMPSHLSYEEAASMPLVFMTSYFMIKKRAILKENEFILIYGGTSGVGLAAIQIAKKLGANIISTAGTKDKCDYIQNLGVDYVINHSKSNIYTEIKKILGNKGVDVIFEHIGKNTWQDTMSILSKGGRVVTCGATTGNCVEINLSRLFIKQQSILGSTMSNISSFIELMNNIEMKKYTPMIDKVFKFKDIALAHNYIESRKQFGKVVLIP